MEITANRLDGNRVPSAEAHPPARPPRVLVVEDDGHLRGLMVAKLRGYGYDVVEAADGVDLLGWIGQAMWAPTDDPLDAVISDLNLPDLTALEVLQALRIRDSTLPVILVTGVEDERAHRRAYELGVSAVLRKPFDVDDLGALVRSIERRAHPKPRRGGASEPTTDPRNEMEVRS